MRSPVRQGGLVALLVATAVVATLLTFSLGGTKRADRPAGPPLPAGSGAETDLQEVLRLFTQSLSKNHDYVPPSPAQRSAFASAVGRLLDGDSSGTDFAPLGYTVTRRFDTGTGREYVEVSEPVPTGRGWGVVYLDTSGPVHRAIQVPHPLADLNTEAIAVELFRRLPGSVLLVAGTHRKAGADDAGDVAHRADSVFDGVHGEFVRRRLPAVQIHGFHDDTVPDTDVVVSTGASEPDDSARAAADALESAGLRTCRVWTRAKRACDRLEALTNVQGRAAAAAGTPFLHVECSRTVRDDPAARRLAAGALAQALAPRAWPGPETTERTADEAETSRGGTPG